MDGLNLVITITDRDRTETAIKLFQECNVFTTDIVLGQGTAPREILEYLYLSPAEKSIIFGVVTHAGLSALLRHLKRKMYIDIPGNGIAVTVPLNSIGGKRVALFGSYGWGDGEWMRSWEKSCDDANINLFTESVICCEAPDDDALAACTAMGKALAE